MSRDINDLSCLPLEPRVCRREITQIAIGECDSAFEIERIFVATNDANKYVGMWVTSNGHIRQELTAKGRYDEARGDKQSAYQGRYEISGNHIQYWDDTGFTADGDFIDDVLHHIGMKFHRM